MNTALADIARTPIGSIWLLGTDSFATTGVPNSPKTHLGRAEQVSAALSVGIQPISLLHGCSSKTDELLLQIRSNQRWWAESTAS